MKTAEQRIRESKHLAVFWEQNPEADPEEAIAYLEDLRRDAMQICDHNADLYAEELRLHINWLCD